MEKRPFPRGTWSTNGGVSAEYARNNPRVRRRNAGEIGHEWTWASAPHSNILPETGGWRAHTLWSILTFCYGKWPIEIVYLPVHLWCFSSSQSVHQRGYPQVLKPIAPKPSLRTSWSSNKLKKTEVMALAWPINRECTLVGHWIFRWFCSCPCFFSPRVSWLFGGIEVKRWEDYGIVLLYRL